LKINKDIIYNVTFTHSLDSNDVIKEKVEGRRIFKLRNFLGDLGYVMSSYELEDKSK